MMIERAKSIGEIFTTCLSLKILFVFSLKLNSIASINNRIVDNKPNNHSCYTCIEPLVGYSEQTDSCRFFNVSSPRVSSYIQECNSDSDDDSTMEYECRKVIISYRSVETYVRRDCAPKGLCSWKDKTQSMIDTPVSDCVYTDDQEQKLECIYCCDTPLCNRTISYSTINQLLICLSLIFTRTKCKY